MAATRMLLVLCPDWPIDDARGFEPVVAAAESFTPRVEVLRPGACAFATRGPSRYFGGDDALAALVADRVDGALSGSGVRPIGVGVADGRFAAEVAAVVAADSDTGRSLRVPRGQSAAFLAPFPVETLEAGAGPADEEGLAHLLRRLGVRTLGDLAELPAPAVLARFGPAGRRAHRLARGIDDVPPAARMPPPDLTAAAELDPPVEQAETVAFTAKSLADHLCGQLAGRGLIATCVRVEAETATGTHLARLWHHDRGLTAAALAQRVRWQLDGWFGFQSHPLSGGITRLRLVPDQVCPDKGRQVGFWGGEKVGDDRAARALARIQGMLGHEAVVTGVVRGGRGLADQIRLVPWGDLRHADDLGRAPPWPGAVPPPAPAVVHPQPLAADVVDAAGNRLTVSGRGQVSAEPSRLQVAGGPWVEVEAWAGPWPLDERWWDVASHRRRARWQMVTIDGTAHLLGVEGGRWWVEATYD